MQAFVCQFFVVPIALACQFLLMLRAFLGQLSVSAVMFSLGTLGCLSITPQCRTRPSWLSSWPRRAWETHSSSALPPVEPGPLICGRIAQESALRSCTQMRPETNTRVWGELQPGQPPVHLLIGDGVDEYRVDEPEWSECVTAPSQPGLPAGFPTVNGPTGPQLARSMGPSGPCCQAPAGLRLGLLLRRKA